MKTFAITFKREFATKMGFEKETTEAKGKDLVTALKSIGHEIKNIVYWTVIGEGEPTHILSKDGRTVFTGTEDNCYYALLNKQSQSTSHAIKYEGWSIDPNPNYK